MWERSSHQTNESPVLRKKGPNHEGFVFGIETNVKQMVCLTGAQLSSCQLKEGTGMTELFMFAVTELRSLKLFVTQMFTEIGVVFDNCWCCLSQLMKRNRMCA